MPSQAFDQMSQASWHGQTLYRTDPGVRAIDHLRGGAPPREIRLLVVNDAMPEMRDDCIEPIDFGVDRGGGEMGHKLVVVDVTPAQWEKIQGHQIELPQGWSLDDSAIIQRGPSWTNLSSPGASRPDPTTTSSEPGIARIFPLAHGLQQLAPPSRATTDPTRSIPGPPHGPRLRRPCISSMSGIG